MIRFKHIGTKYFLAALCLAILGIGTAMAQNDTVPYSEGDTSYYKAGDDDWNLVESVINIDEINVRMLLERGANPSAVSSTGNSALMYAVEKGNMEIMKMLIEKGADVNAIGFRKETPLFISIFTSDFQTTKYLLENGANPNIKDELGVSPPFICGSK